MLVMAVCSAMSIVIIMIPWEEIKVKVAYKLVSCLIIYLKLTDIAMPNVSILGVTFFESQ